MSWLHAVLDLPDDLVAAGTDFWQRALGWPVGEPWPGRPELAGFTPPDGEGYVHRRLVDGPPRVRPELEVDDVDAHTARLTALGATARHRADDRQSLVSPGGLPFGLRAARADHRAPGPVERGGHRVRLMQVCVDLPAERVEDELGFWHAALHGGRWHPSTGAEFLGRWHPDGNAPVRLLFQRLGEPTGPVRAHLDLGTDDLAAEVDRLVGLGARHLLDGDGFVGLRDPVGLPFCVTPNSPEQTVR